MTSNDSLPATKVDLALLMQEQGRSCQADAEWNDQVKRHFDAAGERFARHQMGVKREQVSQLADAPHAHGRGIRFVEEALGIAA